MFGTSIAKVSGQKGDIPMLTLRTQFVCKMMFCILFHTPVLADGVFDFGRVRVGSSRQDTLTFTNESLVPLMITRVSTNHTQITTPAWGLTDDQVRVDAGSDWELPIVFSPTDTQEIATHLNIQTDAGEWGWFLKGKGAREVVVINEVLADPASGERGDANRDGVRNSNEDEFVELFNTGKYGLDMSGWQLFDQGASESKRFRFPAGTWIDPNEYIVIFGGGNVKGMTGKVFVADGKIGGGLRNAGDAIFLVDETGHDTLASMVYGSEGGKNQSLVRWPEGTGAWFGHEAFPGNGLPYSPGYARTVLQGIKFLNQSTLVAVGDTFQVSVQQLFTDASVVDGDVKDLAFALSDTSMLKSLSLGKWVAMHSGTVHVIGQYNALFADTLTINVQPPQLIGLTASVVDSLLLLGVEAELIVKGIDTQGFETLLVNGFEVQVDDQGVVLVQNGHLVAKGEGKTKITVSYQGHQSQVDIRVVAMGDLNADGEHTLWDAVRTVHLILGIAPEGNDFERRAADLVSDSVLDIRDLIALVRLVLGGPVSKLSPESISVGWNLVADGVELFLPHRTVVIHFEMPLPQGDFTLETGFGQVFTQDAGDEVVGVIMVGEVGNNTPRSILVKGLPPHLMPMWTAWTLDGAMYPLEVLDSARKPLEFVRVFPNPANPETTIDFVMPFDQDATLSVYTVTGQWVCQLWQGHLRSGNHQMVWNGKDAGGRPVASGLYFIHLRGLVNQATHKMVILR